MEEPSQRLGSFQWMKIMNQCPGETFSSRQWTYIVFEVSNMLFLYQVMRFLVLYLFIGGDKKRKRKKKSPLQAYTLQGQTLDPFLGQRLPRAQQSLALK